MKKRMIATVLLLVMLVSCCSVVASAETRKNVHHKHDKWVMEVNLINMNFKSTYTDCTDGQCMDAWEMYLAGKDTHWSKVKNNKTGVWDMTYAKHSKKAVAVVKGNWNGSLVVADVRYLK